MAIRIPWDKYEAALLLDTYEKISMGQIAHKDAVRRLSAKLRAMAIKSGVDIDETYRNENGISLQLNNMMNAATYGQKGLPCSTKIFFDIVQLRDESPDEYFRILDYAKKAVVQMDTSESLPVNENSMCIESDIDTVNGNQVAEKDNNVETWDISEYLVSCGVEFIDNSSKGGCLWVVGGYDLRPIIEKLQSHGFVFRFRASGGKATAGRAAWWTKIPVKNDVFDIAYDTSSQGTKIAQTPDSRQDQNREITDGIKKQAESYDIVCPANSVETAQADCELNEQNETDSELNSLYFNSMEPDKESLPVAQCGELEGTELCSSDEQITVASDKQQEDDVSFAKKLGVASVQYRSLSLDKLNLTPRAYNMLRRSGAVSFADLLEYTPLKLREVKGLGAKTYKDIEDKIICYVLSNSPESEGFNAESAPIDSSVRKPCDEDFAFCKAHAEEICNGDFTWVEGADLSNVQNAVISQYKEAYEAVGPQLAHEAYSYTPMFLALMGTIRGFTNETELVAKRRKELRNKLGAIPVERWKHSSRGYLRIFARTDTEIKMADELSKKCPLLIDLVEKSDLLNQAQYNWICKVLMGSAFDINSDITVLIEKLYKKPRDRTVLAMRAEGKTLEATGLVLRLTRERVRQLEAKIKRIFSYWQSRKQYLMRISALRNGDDILTASELKEYFGEHTNELMHLFRAVDDPAYYYDEQLDGFVIGDSSIGTRVQEFIDSMPDTFSADKLSSFIERAYEDFDIPEELLQASINDIYSLTGCTYHRRRLSRASIYSNVLQTHFPNGMRIYDDEVLADFRKIVLQEYGDVNLPANNRAISARLAAIGILCGRGLYCPKSEKYISKDLADRIVQYIEDSPVGIILFATLFMEFEDELKEFGINNRYYLQGVLKELCGDQYFFRRDYISKSSADSSLYSEIVEFIKNSPYPVSKAEIQNVYPGITDVVISFAVMDSEILNYFGKYLHASHLNFSRNDIHMLKQIVTKKVADGIPHHIKEIFPEVQKANSILLSRNAILWPHSLYSVLAYYFEDEFSFGRPYVAMKEVPIARVTTRIKDVIQDNVTVQISDIANMAKDAYFRFNSLLEFLNSFNETHLLANEESLVAIDAIGIDETFAQDIERQILCEIRSPMPVASLQCIHQFKEIGVPWTDWLVYSILKKWSNKLDVEASNKYFKQAVPIVGLKGSITSEFLADYASHEKTEMTTIDNLDNIDELIEDFSLEDWEDT